MNKKFLPIVALALMLLLLNFIGKPYLRQKDALKVVVGVLTHWKNNDLLSAMSYWEKEQDSPPVYDLLDYKIEEKEFGKKDNIHYARISVVLYFPPGNPLPSEKEWLFELNKTLRGWTIINFRLKK